jgi:hypothetical protein
MKVRVVLLAAAAACGLMTPLPAAALSFTAGHYYTTNYDSRTIIEYDADGRVVASFVVASQDADSLKGLAFGPDGLLYVTAVRELGFAVLALDETGTVQATYPGSVYVRGNLSYGKVALDQSYLYVTGQNRLTRFTRGDPASGISIYSNNQVFDVEVLPNGNLLVASAYEIEEITPDGAVVRTLGGPAPEYYTDIRGVEYDPVNDDIFVTHLGHSDFFFRLMRVDATTGALEKEVSFHYADDLFIDDLGRLVVGSRTLSPGIFERDLGLVDQLKGGQQMFVTQRVPDPCYAVDAVDDLFEVVNDGTAQTLAVLGNDRCRGDSPISVIQGLGDLTPDRGGVAATDGTLVHYTPAPGFVGFEEFTYTARDAGLDGGGDAPAVDRDAARVVVKVLENLFPDAVDDAGDTDQGRSVVMDVLANDTLGNGPTHQLTIESEPAHGNVTILSDQTVRYAPDFGFFGEDSFEYRLTDRNGDFDVARATVGVFFTGGEVPIDVMPNDPGNNLNLSGGPGSGFDVAILSAGAYFDAPAQIDALTLKLGPREANIWGSAQARDVDHDGDDDLLVRFLIDQTGIACGDTHVNMTGRTSLSRSIHGVDALNTFRCPRVRKRY